MAEETPPISTAANDTVAVDLGVDKEVVKDLKAEFSDFWAEQDAPAAPAPEAPGAAQETRETKLPKPTKPDVKEPEAKPVKEEHKAPELSDEEIDKLDILPNQRPEVYQSFKNVKEMWKADRARARQLQEDMAKVNRDLVEAKANSMTPELKADYEHAASIRRQYDFVTDPEFVQKYQQPILKQAHNILDEVVPMLPNRQAAIQWADSIKQHYAPDKLDREWWIDSVVKRVPDETNRQLLLTKLDRLFDLQKERDSQVAEHADKANFERWNQDKNTFISKRVQEEIKTEIDVQEKRIQEVLPRDPNSAKTKEERAAIDAHNERFTKINEFFLKQMHDLSANGPRAWVRASIEATRTMIMDEENKTLTERVKSLESENERLQKDLDKILSARSRISQSNGTPPSTSKPSSGGGLSIKDLDVRKSFRDFNWGDQT